ncbi:zinc finger protein 518B [Triplophysa rosa]|uniref:Zinc finger protein 518B n=1 Tax=Triplophysa rosa TaxID=992332 RepID=A0A9W7TR87_TRIRA|nr:zinc finger protein 518B [Triplophysa rosa]KAI7801449.1 putative zinc finger protein 518B [Triplophysa rosa]
MRSQQSFMSFLSKDEAVPTKDNDRLCCAKCRFSTKDMDLFQRHVSHHKEVTFSCALCSHVSYSITESQKHVVLHTGSYPYRCSFCSYGAVRRDYMVKHIQRIHKRSAEKGFFTNFDETTPSCGHPSVTDTHRTSGWPERTEHCMNPSTASQSKGNAHVEYLSGSQPRTSISKTVSKTSSGHSYLTCSSTTRQCVANTTLAQTQFTGAAPSYASSASHSLGNTLQVVPRSGQENGNLSSSLVSGDSQVGKVGCSKPTLEKPSQKASGCTEPPLKSQRSGVPERPIHSKSISKVQVQLPVEMTSPLRPLLNMPSGALTQRTVTTQNGQTDHRVSQSVTGTNSLTSQKKSLTAALINSQVKHSERSPVVSTQREQTTEKSSRLRTTPIILRRSSAKKASQLSNVQVELLAPLNQPIEHNKPLTVSCPEEINIPAGCLVELVEVKNVNGTRELELRLVPPNGTPQDQKYTVDGPTPVATGKDMSFKCQVATESTASPSMSLTCQTVKQQPPSTCSDVQSVRKTQHKPQRSSDTAVQTTNKQNLKSNSPAFRPSVAACEGTEVSSEGLPVISSVFSLCPTPTSTASVSQLVSEFNNSTLQTNGPLFKLQRGLKVISDDESKTAAMKASKENVPSTERSVVCSISIKKEEETEEKPKVEDTEVKESKTELETVENTKTTETCGQENTTQNMLEKCSNLNARDLNDNTNVTNSLTACMPSNKKTISNKDKRDSESQSGNDLDQRSCQASLMYPKVALVRIPSSLLEPNKKVPETPPQEESLTARPVLYCKLTEQNVSSGHEGAIKLILKRDFPEDQNRHAPPRKKHKKGKTRKHKLPSVSMNFQRFLSKDRELRLTPLKEDQLVKLPGPNQPVVVLNHPNPSVQMVSVGVQTLKNYKWIPSIHHSKEQTEVPVSKQSSLKMKLKKVTGQKYRVIELVVRGLSEKLLNV